MVAADEARQETDEQAAEWLAYERRHGTEHPARTADRIARQAAESIRRAPVFTTPAVAELGRAQRQQAPMPVRNAGPDSPWDDNDPDLMEPAQMIHMPAGWRRGPNPLLGR
jgi:hypothetical protein